MISVNNEIWGEWRERAPQFKKPRIDLLLATRIGTEEAVDALSQSVAAAVAELDPGVDLPDGYDEPRVGQCRVAALTDGPVLQIYDSDVLQELIGLIVAGLEQRGVEGRLELYQPPVVPPPPREAPLVECRMRLRGERHHLRSWAHQWIVEPDAFRSVVLAGARWCSTVPGTSAMSLKIDTIPRVAVTADDDLEDRLLRAIERTGVVSDLTCTSVDRYRTMAFTPRDGRVTLIEAGEPLAQKGIWRQPVREFAEFLRENSPRLVYAFVKHGSEWGLAVHADSLMWDWPHRTGADRGGQWFEDKYAPDAFAIQLLGPGYAERLPETPNWRQTPLDDGAVILEHSDFAAWFDTPFAPFGGMNHQGEAFEPPDVLVRAREDVNPILYRDEIALNAAHSG